MPKSLVLQNPRQAVGKNIDKFDGDTRMQIIGVVSDFHQESLHAPIAPLAILTSTDEPSSNSTFHITLKPSQDGYQVACRNSCHAAGSWKQAFTPTMISNITL